MSTASEHAASGSAILGTDFTAAPQTLTFAPGETTKTFSVTIIDDAAVEGTETFTVALSSPTNATIADPVGAGTIADNDAPAAAPSDVPTVGEWGLLAIVALLAFAGLRRV